MNKASVFFGLLSLSFLSVSLSFLGLKFSAVMQQSPEVTIRLVLLVSNTERGIYAAGVVLLLLLAYQIWRADRWARSIGGMLNNYVGVRLNSESASYIYLCSSVLVVSATSLGLLYAYYFPPDGPAISFRLVLRIYLLGVLWLVLYAFFRSFFSFGDFRCGPFPIRALKKTYFLVSFLAALWPSMVLAEIGNRIFRFTISDYFAQINSEVGSFDLHVQSGWHRHTLRPDSTTTILGVRSYYERTYVNFLNGRAQSVSHRYAGTPIHLVASFDSLPSVRVINLRPPVEFHDLFYDYTTLAQILTQDSDEAYGDRDMWHLAGISEIERDMLNRELFSLVGLEFLYEMTYGSDFHEFLTANWDNFDMSLECLLWRMRVLLAVSVADKVLIFATDFMRNPCALSVYDFEHMVSLIRRFSSASIFVFLAEGTTDFSGSDYIYEIQNRDDFYLGATETVRVH